MKIDGFNRRVLAIPALFVLLVGAMIVLGRGAPSAEATGSTANPQQARQPGSPDEVLPPGVVTQTLLSNMNKPVAMAFDPAGRLFYTEKESGNVRLFAGGALQANPVINFTVNPNGEQGLLGVAIDPNFNSNRYIYVYYTCGSCNPLENRVVRFTENNGAGSNPQTIFTSPDDANCNNHNAGNIHFGPDGKLYIAIGDDGCNAQNSQDVTVKNGKIHRINSDGTIPNDNPAFTQTGALPSLYAIGLRNPFDFAFDTVVPGRIFGSENGPNCDDEMNRIVGGYNYGWRLNYPCDDTNPSPQYNTIPPLWYLPQGSCCAAPTGIEVYGGSSIPQWTNDVFMCAFNNNALYHFKLNSDRTLVASTNIVSGVSCGLDVHTGPDGALYYIQGGGYYAGALIKISGSGSPSATATNRPPATSTATSIPSGTVVATATPSACPAQFQDVPSTDTFYPFVTCLSCRNILGGYPCGGAGEPCGNSGSPYFRPGVNVTRGQIAKIVAQAAGISDPAGGQLYEDVLPGSPFYMWINQLSNKGYMSGYPCGGVGEPCVQPGNRPYFRHGANASRGQIAKIASNAAMFNDPVSGQTYQDVAPGSPFYIWIERLSLKGVVGGHSCGGAGEPCVQPDNKPYFHPASAVTRGQAAKIVSSTFFPNCRNRAGSPVGVAMQNFRFAPE